jgi:hypothetical protein
MHYTPVKILFARYIWKCRYVKVAARMNQNVAAIPEGLSTGAVLDFNFPFSVRLDPGRLVDTMRKADMLVQFVLCAKVAEVALDLDRASVHR